eukprot:scaffold1026_cov409-Prasinococcus_capsulatus_cf.AAC.9
MSSVGHRRGPRRTEHCGGCRRWQRRRRTLLGLCPPPGPHTCHTHTGGVRSGVCATGALRSLGMVPWSLATVSTCSHVAGVCFSAGDLGRFKVLRATDSA